MERPIPERGPGPLPRVRRAMAPVAKRLLLGGGIFGLLRRVRPSRRLAILRYHAIAGVEGDRYAEPSIRISPEAFERHIAYLTSSYRVLPLTDAVDCLRRKKSLPSNAVAITFDDGYADNLSAARVLHRYGATATFYITAGCVSGEKPFWPAEVRELVLRLQEPRICLTAGPVEVTMSCADGRDRQAAIRQLSRLLKSHTIPVREALREELRQQVGVGPLNSPMLTWRELAEMHRLGMTIGAHTLTHPNLPSAGRVDACQEITGAKARLEKELGIPVTMFSYPNGGAERYITPEIRQLVRDAGYEAATTSSNGFADASSDLFGLERVQVAERLEDLVFALEVERFAFAPTERTHARS